MTKPMPDCPVQAHQMLANTVNTAQILLDLYRATCELRGAASTEAAGAWRNWTEARETTRWLQGWVAAIS